MKLERPILFSGEMVRAILDGRKTQTRRVMKPQPGREFDAWDEKSEPGDVSFHRGLGIPVKFAESSGRNQRAAGVLTWKKIFCRYGKAGDRLWVRETFMENEPPSGWIYRATDEKYLVGERVWKPSIFMPRKASRITLEVTAVRAERLHEISGRDCAAEGMTLPHWIDGKYPLLDHGVEHDATVLRTDYKDLWDSLNEKRGFGWDKNPWVWVIEFKKISQD